jgi:hypothetical protein
MLNCMKLSFYLAKRAPDPAALTSLSELEPYYLAVERLFDRLQTICRPMALTPIELPLELLIEERRGVWNEWMGSHQRRLEMFPSKQPAIGAFDPNRLGQGLDALVMWRAEVGAPGEPARLRWRVEEQQFRLDWEEPSARGLDPAERAGERAESLALPLLARVIAAHGGRLDWNVLAGLHIGLRWPLAVPIT